MQSFEKVIFTTLVFSFFVFTLQEYQQCVFLSGSSLSDQSPKIESKGEYDSNTMIGGSRYSTSFLVSNQTEILFFFGQLAYYQRSDRAWKYSIEKNTWMFLKGREGSKNKPVFNELHSFDDGNLIGSREAVKGFIDVEDRMIIYLFGGTAYIKDHENVKASNELWRYNVSSNEYAVDRYNYYFDEANNNLFANFTKIGEYDESNSPGGRYYHELVRLNPETIMLIGGKGYLHYNSGITNTVNLDCIWFFSTVLNQWKFLSGELHSQRTIYAFLGETNVYHPNNTIGQRYFPSALLVNEEEVLLFGGNGPSNMENIVQKYNITSNLWKYLSGTKNSVGIVYPGEYGREYNSSNFPGGRKGHQIWRINENEFLTFGGITFTSVDNGYINDEWRYNLKTNLWKFNGKESTKYANRYQNPNKDVEFSENTLMGGMANYGGHFFKEDELLICLGEGYSLYKKGMLNDCFSIYYGNMCYLLRETDPRVCSGHGKCSRYNFCECQEGYFGNLCELTKCNDILSNETDLVCSQKGVCIDSQCLCYEQSTYNNLDCSVNEDLKQFMNNLWLYITVPIAIFVVVIVLVLFIIFSCFLIIKLRKILHKFEGIEDVELILNEAKLDQKSTNPKIKINKALFEVNYKDIQLLSVLGDGGSESVVYLAKWKNNFCAYKGFKTQIFTDNSTSLYEEFEKEVKIFSSIHHPSILQFYGACVNPPKIGILLQYCKFGDLSTFLNKYQLNNGKKYQLKEKLRILFEIASGMNYLHSIGVMHRDLKPENILIDDNEKSKIMDFGLSKLTDNSEKTMTQQIGTSYYMAPEVFKGSKYTNKCDVYSFAVLVLVIITENFFPYGNNVESSVLEKVSKSANFRPNINESVFVDCQFLIPLIKRNWRDDEKERNTFKEIIDILTEEMQKIEKKEDNKIQYSNTKSMEVISLRKKIEELTEINRKISKENQGLKKENQKLKGQNI